VRVPFEDALLPIAEHYHEYLTQVFGDYMQLPPENQRVGLHMLSVDFGKY
jgi:lipopolysaccharide cholinephosphotransferase